MFGHSVIIAAGASGIAKRASYYAHRLKGASRPEADRISDEYAISAAAAAGTCSSIATLDPLGGAATAALIIGMEEDLAQKRNGK